MAYYDRKNSKLDERNMEYLDSGGFANIYFDGEKILKVYHLDSLNPFQGKITLEVFDLLKEIKHPNFMELLDIYSELNLFGRLYRKFNFSDEFFIHAYTAKYYRKDDINPLLENKDYLLDNLNGIDHLCTLLTKLRIRLDDLRTENTIFTNEKMIIIDPDYFRLTTSPLDKLAIHNKESLFALIKDICSSYLEEVLFQENPTLTSSQRIISADKIVNKQFNDIHITEQTDIPAVLSKRLKSVKKPVELFRREQK